MKDSFLKKTKFVLFFLLVTIAFSSSWATKPVKSDTIARPSRVSLSDKIAKTRENSSLDLPNKSDYPHWDFDDEIAIKKLKVVDAYIKKHANKNAIAVFDWDGTLFCENIPVREMHNAKYAGQPAWYLWMAFNQAKFKFPVFPMYNTMDGQLLENVINLTQYLENRTNQRTESYSKYITTALLTAGMTPQNLSEGVRAFMEDIEATQYAFLPMFDIVQNFVNAGIEVWIVTASNPFFVAQEIDCLQKILTYKPGQRYDFRLFKDPCKPANGRIAGNALKLLKDGKFSNAYDDRYVKNNKGNLSIIDERGKRLALRNIQRKTGKKVIFAAGNSGGDFEMLEFVARINKGLCLTVEARGRVKKQIAAKYPNKVIALTTNDIFPEDS